MTLVNVLLSDSRKYSCYVYSVNDGEFDNIASDSETLKIYSLPNSQYPICGSVPNQHVLAAVNKLKLKCISDKSVPLVKLNWSSITSNGYYVTTNASDALNVTLATSVLMNNLHYGILFVYTMKSPGFPERERSCTIGPITVTSGHNGKENAIASRKQNFNEKSNIDKNLSYQKIVTCNVLELMVT